MYLLCDTNFLIPRIKKYDTLEDSLRELQIDTISRTHDYNNKIYVIKENEQNIIYISDGKHIYSINLMSGIKNNIFTNTKINYNGNEYWQQYHLSNTLINDLEQNTSNNIENNKISNNKISDNKISDNMNITINENEKKNKNIRFEDDSISIQDITNNTSIIDKPQNIIISNIV